MNGILFDCCSCCTATHKVRHAEPCRIHQRAEMAAAKKAPKVTVASVKGDVL